MTVDLALYPRFLAYLRAVAVGEPQAVTAASVARALGLAPGAQAKRELRACAQHASVAGDLVCSGNTGYYVPATRDEALAANGRLQAEARALFDRSRRARLLALRQFAHGAPLPLFEERSA